ncbi:MAG: class I SAM-dependent methyltransferase [Inhella sp.]
MTHCEPDALIQFEAHLREALHGRQAWSRAQMTAPGGGDGADLQRVLLRPVILKGQPRVQCVWRHATRDLTQNLGADEACEMVRSHLGSAFRAAALWTDTVHWQLDIRKKGARLTRHDVTPGGAQAPAADPGAHNRDKVRWLDAEDPVWRALGLMHDGPQGRAVPVPAMARKWRQINHFVEIFDAALRQANVPLDHPVRVADFGCGKGYLTFAVHAHLRALGREPQVLGVELRQPLVAECQALARRLGLVGLDFAQGDVGHQTVQPLDVMIALHACDTATDHALHHGLRAGASIVLTAPCCHKQLRGQMQPPGVLQPLFKHGVHLGQEAEMLTDGLRALLMEAQGFETQVFEFVSLEHTQQNKMILATRRRQPQPARQQLALTQAQALKSFWGIREQALEQLLLS